MKNTLLSIILLFTIPLLAQNESVKMEINGVYLGKNAYIQNPYGPNGVGFCTTGVEVNGHEMDLCETTSSAFEIDLPAFHLSYGDSLHLVIYHHDDCKPKLLNPEAFFTHSSIFINFWIDSSATIHFIANDIGWSSHSYRVWQYRWGKWVQIGESMKCVGGKHAEYILDTKPFLINGENKFWVTLPIPCGHFETENSVSYRATVPPVLYDSHSKCNTVTFSGNTLWELYDHAGNLVKKGYGQQIDYGMTTQQNSFWLNYDDKTTEFEDNRCYVPEMIREVVLTDLLVYPNPADDHFDITTSENMKGYSLTLEIMDLTGRLVLSQDVQGDVITEINVKELSDGIYLVRLKSNDTQVSSTKIAVHH